ncbi:hypothetical protein ES288_A10G117900v1 [Gossypium darwinii]|uniref:Uncharacterized protein n=1 Tax=Gossypium darwinii TaxID=34276 RepID=A0A5D2EXF4_GOSDA|nr:hypothetical protein ES288_A10G117900v1 [Gossypium darwinii]TYG98444.1 hypothetical protein ES288_A10G117900v1 [Gossypium darwinii]
MAQVISTLHKENHKTHLKTTKTIKKKKNHPKPTKQQLSTSQISAKQLYSPSEKKIKTGKRTKTNALNPKLEIQRTFSSFKANQREP